MNMNPPDPNVRRLKRIPADGKLVYTLETESDRKRDNLLCNFCAWKLPFDGYLQCSTFKRLHNYADQVGLLVRTCPEFQPIITFRPPIRGTDESFNTFRLGTAWANRLSKDTIVGLMNSQTGDMIGKAVVEEVLVGPIEAMCSNHAANNHLLLGSDPHKAPERMMRLIRQSYGRLPMQQADEVTVVYMRNLNGTDY